MAESPDGPWAHVLTGSLDDERSISPIPNKHFKMSGKGRYAKFTAEEIYSTYAGLQYLYFKGETDDNLYKAENALNPSICDHYTFNHKEEGFR